ncbi:CBS domain-containing protein [Sulfobacillus thermotolerans]|uniref:CBS domain-containing protein n=1 Tax=Sulfobacillus thermotolerans TaxID=338644 RepID=UPI003367AA1D
MVIRRGQMKVKDIMTHKVSTVAPSDSIEHAAKIMKQLHCGSTPGCGQVLRVRCSIPLSRPPPFMAAMVSDC